VFTHSPHCRRAGTKKVRSQVAVYRKDDGGSTREVYFAMGARPQGVNIAHGDEDGTETVAAWKCTDDCPVKKLDDMSGDRRVSGTATTGAVIAQPSPGYHGGAYGSTVSALYDDFGTASRYYPQFADRQELLAWLAKLVGQ
jgi:hypothetical protein